jgi:probable FeS assembly SUF system protein SufT
VSITQALGGSYTLLVHTLGGLFRLADRDADAIGKEPAVEEPASAAAAKSGSELRDEVWAQLKTCFDPEIPVNIVDLGLIYELNVEPHDSASGGSKVGVKMTLTAQGCGMGDSIAADAQRKIERVRGVSSALVEIVWDPPWTPERISAQGKELLGMG